MRIQSIIPLMLTSKKFGEISVTKEALTDFLEDDKETPDIPVDLKNGCEVTEDDLLKISDIVWPSIVYISGYAAFSVLRHIKCKYCQVFLTDTETADSNISLISANDRGGLCYPHQDVVTCTAYTYLVLDSLLKNEDCYLRTNCQKSILKSVSLETIDGLDVDLFLGHNCSEHSIHLILNLIIKCICNILLKNYVKKQNDALKPKTMPQVKRVKSTKT